jgi:hypothetical protein
MPERLDGLPRSDALSGQRVLDQYVDAQNSWMMRLMAEEQKSCGVIAIAAVDFARRINRLSLELETHANREEWSKAQDAAAKIMQLGRLAELRMLIVHERCDSALKFALACVNEVPDKKP